MFVARDEELHREVALKEIQPRFADQPESRHRFLLEANAAHMKKDPDLNPLRSREDFKKLLAELEVVTVKENKQ